MTYYELLEVSEAASEEMIRMAYRLKTKKYHPDVFAGDKQTAEEMMKKINLAAEVLLNPNRRTEYDRYLILSRKNTATSNDKSSTYGTESEAPNPFKKKETKYTKPTKGSKAGAKAGWIFVALMLILSISLTLKERFGEKKPILDEPNTGYCFVWENCGFEGVSPLEINNTRSDGCYIVVDLVEGFLLDETANELLEKRMRYSFYVRGGDTFEIQLPLGIYEVYYATGDYWYGEEELFGRNTIYKKFEESFDFVREGEGWTISLIEVQGGNLEAERIDAEEFPK